MNCLFGGNSCTWVLILVIIFLLSQNGSFCCGNDYNTANNGCGCTGYTGNNCGCGCETDRCGCC